MNGNETPDEPGSLLLGKICIGKTATSRFAARLIKITPTEFWFENKNGEIFMQNRAEVSQLFLGKQVPREVVCNRGVI